MSRSLRKFDAAQSKRRFLLHLSCTFDSSGNTCRYIVRIRPWSARRIAVPHTRERAFADVCELAEVINPLLAPGSDVRDVLGHIESPEGFLYLLHLTVAEADRLGWSS
jgi:hypothetical protein